jgi:hypothetical protein
VNHIEHINRTEQETKVDVSVFWPGLGRGPT